MGSKFYKKLLRLKKFFKDRIRDPGTEPEVDLEVDLEVEIHWDQKNFFIRNIFFYKNLNLKKKSKKWDQDETNTRVPQDPK